LRAATGSAVAAQTLAELTYKRSTVALIAYNVAEKAHKAGLLVVTAAQWAYNVALSANPIGLVIIAVAALGAAFVIAYKRIEPFRNLIDSIWDKVKGLAKTLTGGIGKLFGIGGNAASKTIAGARALGGQVLAGQSYLVGERGAEIFTPSVSGNITPNNRMGGSVTYNIVMNGIVDGESARRSIERVLQDSARRSGAINIGAQYV
jgi:phage-related protein